MPDPRPHPSAGWTASWAGSLGGSTGDLHGPEATLRQSFRLSAGGSALRLRLSNPFSYSPLVLDHVTVGIAGAEPASLAGRPCDVRVGGETRIEVGPGETVYSDPVPIATHDLDTLTVSVYCAGVVEVTKHDFAGRLSHVSLVGGGDRSDDEAGGAYRPFGTSWYWIDAVDVLDASVAGALVVLGDSITDGAGADFGSDTRWTDFLAEALLALPVGDPRRTAVVNAGIGGNTLGALGTPIAGVNGLARLDRDALSLSGAREVVVFLGTNDVFVGASAERVIVDLQRAAERIKAAGLRSVASTLVPRGGGYLWDERHEANRQTVNGWLREQSVFDWCFDADRALADPDRPDRILAAYDADHTHPNSAGNRALAAAFARERLARTSSGPIA